MGRTSFTRREIEELRGLIREKQIADGSRQKVLRARMRAIGFYISDFAADSGGFVASDLDDLINRGVITISAEPDGSLPAPTNQRGSMGVRVHPQAGARAAWGPAGNREVELDSLISEAVSALERAQALSIAEAAESVPSRPGLYAIHGSAEVWIELGLGEPPDERPLYVGKAARSLVSRDIDTHFGNGRTGSSTVRRSFAALLRTLLGLKGRPRNPAKPERPASYGLSPGHDERLTVWMRDHLLLATWSKPEGSTVALGAVEKQVLQLLAPPLNLKDVVTPWTALVKQARAVMADQARSWTPGA